jgi:hypothetical protein
MSEWEIITDPEHDQSADGQIIDRIIELTNTEELNDLQVIEEIWKIINDATKRGLI